MLIFEICPTNLKFLTVINGGLTPMIESKTTYLVVEPGYPNRIISEEQFRSKEFEGVESTMRKFWFA